MSAMRWMVANARWASIGMIEINSRFICCSLGVLHGGDADAADDPAGNAVRLQVRGFRAEAGGRVPQVRAARRRQPLRPVVHGVAEGVLARPAHRPPLPFQEER